MIVLDDVALTLNSRAGAVNILRAVNLRVNAGESVSVMGPSGAGKTSLLMIVARLEQAHADWAAELADTPILPSVRSTLVDIHGATVQLFF